MKTHKLVQKYISQWMTCGYPDGIPDEVPDALMKKKLAPSYKAIAIAILKNDMHLSELGFASPVSEWYGALKKEEIAERNIERQRDLFL